MIVFAICGCKGIAKQQGGYPCVKVVWPCETHRAGLDIIGKMMKAV